MMDPRPVQKRMLVGVVDCMVSEEDLDFGSARAIAEAVARESLHDPMLLAWFDGETGKHSPAIC